MRPIGSHQANPSHAHQVRRDGGGAQAGQRAGRSGPAAAPAQQDTFQSQSPQASYQQASAALAGDPEGQRALRGMLASGKLDGATMDQLGRLAQSGDTALLGQVVRDVSNPGSIRQGKGNEFCAATTSLSELAANKPSEYARIAADLKLTGQSRTAGGQVIKAQGAGAPGMTATQRLMAPALTEQANGRRYDVNAQGVSHANNRKHAPRDTPRLEGTWALGMERMQEMLNGGNYRSLYIPGGQGRGRGRAGSPTQAVNQAENVIGRSIAGGQAPSVSQNGHWYRVTGQGGGQLTVQDQQTGQERTVNAAQFLRNSEAVTFDGAAGKVGRGLRKPGKNEDPGGGYNGVKSSNPVEDGRVW